MAERVRITDVAPRDGLQHEPGVIPTERKVRLVELLVASGVDEVEVSSFVSPQWVPQLADAAEVLGQAARFKSPRTMFSALVPNERGMRGALDLNGQAGRRIVDKVAVFTAASEPFSKRNTNATIAETIARFRPVVRLAREHGLATRGYVSCAIECPLAGPTEPAQVADVCRRLLDLGVEELDLADTIGAARPEQIDALLEHVLPACGVTADAVTIHLHDTTGRAAACVQTALARGIRSFDGAAGGLGGCPYASTPERRAPGNLATEALVRAVSAAGYRTGVDTAALTRAGAFARQLHSA